jgi:succinoglycan biosynthesis protein ExoW
MANPKVSVIIPFYQKEKGILEKAVRSVLSQKNYSNYEIIVVDDGSPVNSREELAGLLSKYPAKIRLIEQKNAGPGAARNKGIDSVSKDTKYAAFLDSDDQWTEGHLENAVYALEKGYDLYFADIKHYKYESPFKDVLAYKHSPIDPGRGLSKLDENFFNILIYKDVVATSTFVYRYEKYPGQRFNEAFYNGQDYIFWLDLSLLTNRVIFADKVEAVYGEGVNIWGGATWGSENVLKLCANNMKLTKYVASHYLLDLGHKKFIKDKIDSIRYAITTALVHNIKHGKRLDVDALNILFKTDVMTIVYLLPNIVKIIASKINVRTKNDQTNN